MMEKRAFEGFDVAVDNKAKLEAKFIIPPFSVLDTRQGYWQERKRLWLAVGLQSEIGRGEDITFSTTDWVKDHGLTGACQNKPSPTKSKVNGLTFRSTGFMADLIAERGGGTSIFDPVLCELIYKWFCPVGGEIFDPFAGGSVRGIVASILGHNYTGLDLALAQIEANRQQAEKIVPDKKPEWIVGDSFASDLLLPQGKHYDLIFSCPPYHDLEKYTDEAEDLSNMSWSSFKDRYKAIIEKAILRLNSNRFAVFVVSEIRGENGDYKGLVPLTIQSFVNGGARYYNEMILVNVAGSLPVRIAGQFAYRKIGRTHQNVLVFYKGDIEEIPKYFKEIDTAFNYGGNGDGV